MSDCNASSTQRGIGHAPASQRMMVRREMPRATARPSCESPASMRRLRRLLGVMGGLVVMRILRARCDDESCGVLDDCEHAQLLIWEPIGVPVSGLRGAKRAVQSPVVFHVQIVGVADGVEEGFAGHFRTPLCSVSRVPQCHVGVNHLYLRRK